MLCEKRKRGFYNMGDSDTKQEAPVVGDFKRETDKRKKQKFRHTKKNGFSSFCVDNKQALILFAAIIVMLAVILASILMLKMPVVPVCLLVVLEALLAVCLQQVPIWLHGLVAIVQIVTGALCAKLIFAILCAVVYVVAILALQFFRS